MIVSKGFKQNSRGNLAQMKACPKQIPFQQKLKSPPQAKWLGTIYSIKQHCTVLYSIVQEQVAKMPTPTCNARKQPLTTWPCMLLLYSPQPWPYSCAQSQPPQAMNPDSLQVARIYTHCHSDQHLLVHVHGMQLLTCIKKYSIIHIWIEHITPDSILLQPCFSYKLI